MRLHGHPHLDLIAEVALARIDQKEVGVVRVKRSRSKSLGNLSTKGRLGEGE